MTKIKIRFASSDFGGGDSSVYVVTQFDSEYILFHYGIYVYRNPWGWLAQTSPTNVKADVDEFDLIVLGDTREAAVLNLEQAIVNRIIAGLVK